MTIIGVLGSVHSEKMREEHKYPLSLLKKVILDFKPDIICAEIRPEDWKKHLADSNYTGYLGPNEYRNLILPLCKEHKIDLVPVDWYEDDMVGMQYRDGQSDEDIAEYEKELKDIMTRFWDAASSNLPFNSNKFNRVVEEKQDLQKNLNEPMHRIYWELRNEMMTFRIKNVINNSPNKRILCIAGAEHCYYYLHELHKVNNIDIVFPLKH